MLLENFSELLCIGLTGIFFYSFNNEYEKVVILQIPNELSQGYG